MASLIENLMDTLNRESAAGVHWYNREEILPSPVPGFFPRVPPAPVLVPALAPAGRPAPALPLPVPLAGVPRREGVPPWALP